MRRASAVLPGPAKNPGSSFVMLGAPERTRAPVIRDLRSIGFSNPNFVNRFSVEQQLPEHIAARILATTRKRIAVIAMLHALEEKGHGLQVHGALLQDRRGSSSVQRINGKAHLSGTQAAHISIGTWSLCGSEVSEVPLRELQAGPASLDMKGNLRRLTAYLRAQSAMTELVPAFMNLGSSLIEVNAIHYMKGLLPVVVSADENSLSRQLDHEGHRMLDTLVNKRITLVRPIEERLQLIRAGRGEEYLQNPADTGNLPFEGRESVFLQSLLEEMRNPQGKFSAAIETFARDLPRLAEEFAEIAASAQEERNS
jgi:hypothetical protein